MRLLERLSNSEKSVHWSERKESENFFLVMSSLLQQLQEFGIEEELAKQALTATGNKTVDAALNW